jgi:hypothetical protein
MASSLLLTAFKPYVDIPFNVWLTIILILTYGCALRNPGLLLLVEEQVQNIAHLLADVDTAGCVELRVMKIVLEGESIFGKE